MISTFKSEVQRYLQCCDNASTHQEKGRTFEDLICYAFECIPGIMNIERDQRNVHGSEEIDFVFYNELFSSGLPSPAFPPYIFVECKNWSTRVSTIDVSWFDAKLRRRGLDFGILIAANGITGDREHLTQAHHIISQALAERRKILVITREDLEALSDWFELVKLLKIKQGKLLLTLTSLL